MHKLAIILVAMIALLFAGLLTLNAQATTVTAAGTIGAKNYSPIVQQIGCRRNAPLVGAHGCARGTHWVCVKKTCWCADCTGAGE
jgi:hypothetical protein